MSIYTALTRRALVRWQYSDDATLRQAMGNAEELLAFACSGPIDAPEFVPAGGSQSSKHGPMQQYASRF